MSPAIAVEHLVKRYGARVALGDVSFAVARGEVVGLLGPNGAGKSTTLGILATLLAFDAGRVRVAGEPLPSRALHARRALGLVPQRIAVYPTLTARENLAFFGAAFGMPSRAAAAAAGAALERLGLADRADEPVERFSIGMQRRLNLACGILHAPAVVLLDEPTVGIDPQSRERVFDAVGALRRAGAAVLYSTHLMDEAERLCDRVVLLDAGRLVAQGTPAEVVAQTGLVPRAHVVTTRPLPAGWLDDVPGGRLLEAAGTSATVALVGAAAVPAVLAAVARGGAEVVELSLHRPNLADAFFALTGRALRDDAGAAEPSA